MVLLNVLVSSKPDKSNQVLSGSATISWLFEPSGPCSSDLWFRTLSMHLEAKCREKKDSLGLLCVHIISTMMTQALLSIEQYFKESLHLGEKVITCVIQCPFKDVTQKPCDLKWHHIRHSFNIIKLMFTYFE